MTNDNDKLVIAYYVNAAAAEAAAEDLKKWDKDNDDIKLGAIGVITLNEHDGTIEVSEIGQRNTKKGALWGTAIGAGLGILTAGIAFIPGMIIGAAVGAGAGALDHKNLGMNDEEIHDLAAHLKNGGAALGVMCDDFEVVQTMAKMVEEGGKSDHYELAGEISDAVADHVEAQVAASAAVDGSVEDTADHAAVVVAATGASAEGASRLSDVGVDKPSALLEQASTPQGRKELADETGMNEDTILVAVKKMDLMRIEGVGIVYADLLHESGVETVPDLARRNPTNLAAKMAEVNAAENIAEALPSEEEVTGWVAEAKDLPRVITY